MELRLFDRRVIRKSWSWGALQGTGIIPGIINLTEGWSHGPHDTLVALQAVTLLPPQEIRASCCWAWDGSQQGRVWACIHIRWQLCDLGELTKPQEASGFTSMSCCLVS